MGNCTSSLETIPIPGVDGPFDETTKGLLMKALSSKEETEENMRKLIASNVDVNHKIEYESIGSCYPLHIACKVGNANAVDLLLKGGANPNLTDSQGKTPLHWAISEEHPDVIDELLQAKPDVNIASLDLMTPLNLAVKKNDSDLVQKLLNAGASVSPEKGEHPLVFAVKGQHLQVIMPLLRGNASPVGETFEFQGKPATMLIWAEGNNHGEIASFLKQKFPEENDENDKREGGDGAEDTAIPDEGGPPPDTAETVDKDGGAHDDGPEENDDQCGTCDEPDCGGEEHADEGEEATEDAEAPEDTEAHEEAEANEDTEAPEDVETQDEEEEAAAAEEAEEEAPTEAEAAAAEEEAVIDGDTEAAESAAPEGDGTSSKGDENEDTPDGGGRVVTDV